MIGVGAVWPSSGVSVVAGEALKSVDVVVAVRGPVKGVGAGRVNGRAGVSVVTGGVVKSVGVNCVVVAVGRPVDGVRAVRPGTGIAGVSVVAGEAVKSVDIKDVWGHVGVGAVRSGMTVKGGAAWPMTRSVDSRCAAVPDSRGNVGEECCMTGSAGARVV